jgi:hypothetical protein
MEFRIADTFTDALARLPTQEQKAAKTSAFDLQMNPASPGLQFHRIDKSKDPNFWSMRVNRDLRIIVHKTALSILLAYVGHHDKAYEWAERRRIEAHPKTGAIQIVEVRERIEESTRTLPFEPIITPVAERPPTPSAQRCFEKLSHDQVLSVGVPEDWVADVLRASEDSFLGIADHLPQEAAEALLEYATTGTLPPTRPKVAPKDAYAHPDALRRFRIVENAEELRQALDYPWEKWLVFLHPSQRAIAEQTFAGPARVAGSAGTGKTVVALHRAARLARTYPNARILLTTFSRPLANMLEQKLKLLTGENNSVIPRITVTHFHGIANELYQLAFGRRPQIASDEIIRGFLVKAAESLGASDVSERFLVSEWAHVVDAWQIDSEEAYASVPRLGRKNRMSAKLRARLGPVFAATRKMLAERGLFTWAQIFGEVAAHYTAKPGKPFDHIVVDEAQDLGVPELRFLAAIAPTGADPLFFAGDLGQRIFQQPFSWLSIGIDVRERTYTLDVNYRTSHQIREAADRLLPATLRDVDGIEQQRVGTISAFNGPDPQVTRCISEDLETLSVGKWLKDALSDGFESHEIGIFVRTNMELDRARHAVNKAGRDVFVLSDRSEAPGERISIGTMHLAKGLEFRAVVVMACDDDILPLQSRVEAVADETELDDVYETERQLFYVACTRARDRLLISGALPVSEFLEDLGLH